MVLSDDDVRKLDECAELLRRVADEHTGWGVALFVHREGSVAIEMIHEVIGQTRGKRTWLRDCEDGYDPIDASPGESLRKLVAA